MKDSDFEIRYSQSVVNKARLNRLNMLSAIKYAVSEDCRISANWISPKDILKRMSVEDALKCAYLAGAELAAAKFSDAIKDKIPLEA